MDLFGRNFMNNVMELLHGNFMSPSGSFLKKLHTFILKKLHVLLCIESQWVSFVETPWVSREGTFLAIIDRFTKTYVQ